MEGDCSRSELRSEADSSTADRLEMPDRSSPSLADAFQSLQTAIRNDEFSGPRANYLSWDEVFMSTSFLIAMRSKDPVTQVGACIVNEANKIVGIGYNGMPNGCDDKLFPWGKSGDPLHRKFMFVCHAEMNAVLNRNTADVNNCKIYVGLFPCNECAKIIIQSGIKEVIFLSDKNKHKPETIASKIMFQAAGVTFRQFFPQNTKITIDFSNIDWGNMSQLPTSPIK